MLPRTLPQVIQGSIHHVGARLWRTIRPIVRLTVFLTNNCINSPLGLSRSLRLRRHWPARPLSQWRLPIVGCVRSTGPSLSTRWIRCIIDLHNRRERPAYRRFWLDQVGGSTRQNSCFLILFFCVWASPSWAATYYVATTGDNSNPGTIGSPWLTIAKAAGSVSAGDTVLIRAGVYREYLNINSSGTSVNRITFQNYPSETPIVDGGDHPLGTGNPLIQINGNFVTVRGLEMRNFAWDGIYINGTDAIIDQMHIHHGYLSGIRFWQTYRGLILNSNIHDVFDFPAGGNADCISVSGNNDIYGYHTIDGNELWNCSDDGLDMWRSSHNTVRNNRIHHNGLNSSGGYGQTGHKNPYTGGHSTSSANGNGNGIKAGAEAQSGGGGCTGCPTGEGTVIYNNIAWYNQTAGFDCDGGQGQTWWNNTGWSNPKNFMQYDMLNNTDNNTYVNNLSWDGGIDWSGHGVADHNSWNLGNPNPNFLSIDPSSPNFLKLSASSPAIDAGANVGLPYSGRAPDLGAYEYAGSGDSKPPLPPEGLKVF